MRSRSLYLPYIYHFQPSSFRWWSCLGRQWSDIFLPPKELCSTFSSSGGLLVSVCLDFVYLKMSVLFSSLRNIFSVYKFYTDKCFLLNLLKMSHCLLLDSFIYEKSVILLSVFPYEMCPISSRCFEDFLFITNLSAI